MKSPLPWLLVPFLLLSLLLGCLGRRESAEGAQDPVLPEVRPPTPAERIVGTGDMWMRGRLPSGPPAASRAGGPR